MDIRMPGLTASPRADGWHRPVCGARLMLTTFDRDDYLYDAKRQGRAASCSIDAPCQLVHAIRTRRATGDALLAPRSSALVEDSAAAVAGRRAAAGDGQRFTQRELEVLRLVARGLSNAEIAKELFFERSDVKTHLAHVMQSSTYATAFKPVVLA